MILRVFGALLAVLVLVPLAWRVSQSDSVRDWWSPPPPAKAIQFDNGSVRAPALPASGSTASVAPGLKKCRVAERFVYTDGPCPKGSAVVPIGGTVNVVPGTRPVQDRDGAEPAADAASQARRPRHVRDVLDVSKGPSLYDQHIERVTAQAR